MYKEQYLLSSNAYQKTNGWFDIQPKMFAFILISLISKKRYTLTLMTLFDSRVLCISWEKVYRKMNKNGGWIPNYDSKWYVQVKDRFAYEDKRNIKGLL